MTTSPFPTADSTPGDDFDYSFVETIGHIAIYDDMRSEPRVIDIPPAETAAYIEALASGVYEHARGAGGSIPYTVIREVTENFIHAQFKEALVTVLDHGNTIRFADHGPGIPSKEKAQMPGFSSAVEPMRNYIRGVGSGLPRVREYLELSNGTITIEDNLGTGAVVTISLVREAGDDELSRSYEELPLHAPMGAEAQMQPVNTAGGQEFAQPQAIYQPSPAAMPTQTPMAVPLQPQPQPYGMQAYQQVPPSYGNPYPAVQGQPYAATYPPVAYQNVPTASYGLAAAPMPAYGPTPVVSVPALSDIQRKFLHVLSIEGVLGNKEVAEQIGAIPSTVTNNFKALREMGLVEHMGQKYTLTALGQQVARYLQ